MCVWGGGGSGTLLSTNLCIHVLWTSEFCYNWKGPGPLFSYITFSCVAVLLFLFGGWEGGVGGCWVQICAYASSKRKNSATVEKLLCPLLLALLCSCSSCALFLSSQVLEKFRHVCSACRTSPVWTCSLAGSRRSAVPVKTFSPGYSARWSCWLPVINSDCNPMHLNSLTWIQ